MKIYTKKAGIDYPYDGNALALDPCEVLKDHLHESGEYTRTHDDGWIITGFIQNDYYYWVNDFTAFHPKYGKLHGNFEDAIYYTNKRGFDHFYKNHKPNSFNYDDI